MRDASPAICQWDKMACETACTAQLLYIHGRLELDDVRTLDRRIGRKAGEADLKNGNLRLIFEAGFHVTSISSVDLERLVGPHGMSYLRRRWIDEGDAEEDVDNCLSEVYPKIRARAVEKLTLIRRFPGQYEHQLREATFADFSTMVMKGWQTGCDLIRTDGQSHHLLVIQGGKGGKYQVFDPTTGLRNVVPRTFFAHLLSAIEGYHLPS